MSDLDEREESFDVLLRSAAHRLRDDMGRAAIPPLRRRRHSYRRRWVIALVATAAIVVGLVAIGTNRNDQSIGNDPARLHWLVTDLPDDVPLVALLDPTAQPVPPDTLNSTVMFNLYATDVAPLGPLLTVRGSMGMPDLELVPAQAGTNITELTIDGRRAAFADGQTGQRLLFIETGGHWISLTSRNIDDAQLQAMAAAAVRTDDGNASIPPAALVDGLTLVLGADSPITELFGGANVAGADYAAPDTRSVSLRVAFPRPAARALAGMEAALAPTEVAGVNGFIGNYGNSDSVPPQQVTLVWWERSGLDFTVRGTNVDPDVVVKAANSVDPASDDKWRELLTATGYGGGAAPAGTVPAVAEQSAATTPPFTGVPHDVAIDVSVAEPSANDQEWSGTLPTGEAWTVRIRRVYDSFRMESEIDGVPSGGFTTGSVVRAAGQEIGCCPPNVITADPKAVSFRVVRGNGDRYTIPLHDLPGEGGLRAAFIALPDGGGVQQAELLDADGNILQSTITG